MEALKSENKKRVLPTWMTAHGAEKKTTKRRRADLVPTAAARLPATRTVYCMNEAEMVDVALGILIERVKEAQAHLLCLPFLLLSRAENRKSLGSSRPWPALISQRAPRPARRRRHRVPPGPGVRTRSAAARTPLRRSPALPRGPPALSRPAAQAPSRTTMR
ncbi:cell cycle regulator of non-homologous end joining isoform X1 [Phacochoerus africanus]|uniref:cell cycle regulator of non-homologous end joining isoform X1 n=1 Tax=Phacochoerus africanus TaxID=41426 RepID=UPI001FD9974C|nr:cell cycle regulator of non-homologous end joining isoform X1 [Phacochoerus africanus]